jgi:hypothetical protein
MQDVSVPFEWWLFALATCLNLLIQATRLVGISIDFAVRLSAGESARYNQLLDRSVWHSGGEQAATQPTESMSSSQTPESGATRVPVGKLVDAAEEREHRDLTETPPFGAIVGFIERQLYLYALFTKTPDIIAAVLMFKAFSGWIAGEALRKTAEKDLKVLARFYVYAIGNFVSLLWAVLIFQLCLLFVQYSKPAKELLCIGCG